MNPLQAVIKVAQLRELAAEHLLQAVFCRKLWQAARGEHLIRAAGQGMRMHALAWKELILDARKVSEAGARATRRKSAATH